MSNYTWYADGKWVDGDADGPSDREAKCLALTTGAVTLTAATFEKGVAKMHKASGLNGYVLRKTAMPPEGTQPTRGYIQHLSRIPPGERWPVLAFRVCGFIPDNSRVAALLDVTGTWRWFDCAGAFAVPEDCHLSQGQVGDVLARAGIAPGLPFMEPDRYNMADIVYVEPLPASAQAKVEEWRPDAPKWRGGKPWR
jgi:hypothetical protein